MTEKSNEENQIPEFRQIIAGYSDEELRKVLIKRELYQKEAADFAVNEAIKRGLIYSEQDLFSKEFQHEPKKFAIFPDIENEELRAKFKRSITRALIILGALPMVWGGIRIYKMQSIEGILLFTAGAVWSIISFKLMQKVNSKLIGSLYLLLVLVVAYFVKIFVEVNFLKVLDVIFVVTAIVFITWGLGFLTRLKD